MQNVQLTIEKSSDGSVWGRVEYDNDLLVDAAKSEEALERKFRRLLKVFHQVDPDKIKFKIAYDPTSKFDNEYAIVHHSAAIEGSTLTENETRLLLEEGTTPKGKPLQHKA